MEALRVVWDVKHFRHYFYSHRCTVYTDHEALKSLLNTLQPSRKLARWGLALQEVELDIQFRLGKKNSRADTLSRHPVPPQPGHCSEGQVPLVIAAVEPLVPLVQSGERNSDQISPNSMISSITWRTGSCSDDKRAKENLLGQTTYTVLDGVLYRIADDKSLRIIPPAKDQPGGGARAVSEQEETRDAGKNNMWRGRLRLRTSRSRTIVPRAGKFSDYQNDSDRLIFMISLLHSHIRYPAYISVRFAIIIEFHCRVLPIFSCNAWPRTTHAQTDYARHEMRGRKYAHALYC